VRRVQTTRLAKSLNNETRISGKDGQAPSLDAGYTPSRVTTLRFTNHLSAPDQEHAIDCLHDVTAPGQRPEVVLGTAVSTCLVLLPCTCYIRVDASKENGTDSRRSM
jgi:hypothetical protein